jgi:flagellin-like protein
MKKHEKAVSPVIATVLLVLVVVILATIILIWSFSFVKEAVEKEIAGEKKRAEQYCSEVKLDPFEDPSGFGFVNSGNVPIYAFKIKFSPSGGSTYTKTVTGKEGQINPGATATISEGQLASDFEEVKVIPILLGKVKSGGYQEFQCPESDSVKII